MDYSKLPHIPFEIQEIILSFIPTNEMNNVKSVCKAYNQFCSEIQNYEIRLDISARLLDDESIVNSMKNTLRKFNRLTINIDDFSHEHHTKTMSILAVHGQWIESLRLEGYPSVYFKQSYFVEWVNSMPDLEKLTSVSYLDSTAEHDETPLNLPHINIVWNPPHSIAQKLHLTPNASLNTLYIGRSYTFSNLDKIFQKHASTLRVLRLVFYAFPYNSAIFKPLQLYSLELCDLEESNEHNFFDVIDNQKELRNLNLGDVFGVSYTNVSSRLLNLICNLKELKEVEIGISNTVQSFEIRQFSKLKKIEHVSLKFQDHSKTKEFFKISLPSLKKLELPDAMDIECFSDICNNFPNLELMRVDFETDDDTLVSLETILNGLPKLNELALIHSYNLFLGTTYPNLKILVLWHNDDEYEDQPAAVLSADFFRALPNLEEIRVEKLVGDVETFKALLASKIKKINVRVPMTTMSALSNIERLMELKNELEKKGLQECKIKLIP